MSFDRCENNMCLCLCMCVRGGLVETMGKELFLHICVGLAIYVFWPVFSNICTFCNFSYLH